MPLRLHLLLEYLHTAQHSSMLLVHRLLCIRLLQNVIIALFGRFSIFKIYSSIDLTESTHITHTEIKARHSIHGMIWCGREIYQRKVSVFVNWIHFSRHCIFTCVCARFFLLSAQKCARTRVKYAWKLEVKWKWARCLYSKPRWQIPWHWYDSLANESSQNDRSDDGVKVRVKLMFWIQVRCAYQIKMRW